MNQEEKNKEVLELQEEVKSLKKIIYCLGGDFDEGDSGSSIDFAKILKTLWAARTTYFKALPVAFLLAVIYTLGLPNYYQCEVKLSPELSGSKSTSSLASIASNFGINLGGATGNATEALFPTLYPELMNSVKFKTSLFPIPVTIKGDEDKGEKDRIVSYYDYLRYEQKTPWWSKAKKAVFSIFASDTEPVKEAINAFQLTKEQNAIVKALDQKIVCDVDKKTMMITINVTDQDPVICAQMADSVQVRLQEFITQYRTKKARVDLEYNKKLFAEAKARYEHARKQYAGYSDANQRVFLESVLSKKSALEHEMQLQYQAYSQVSAQLLAAEAKVQEETPAFTALKDATVPVEKSGPSRAKMCILFTFLVFLGTSVYILYTAGELKSLLGKS